MYLKLRSGLGFGLQVLSGVLFAQLLIVLINPPSDRIGYLAVVIAVDIVVVLAAAAVAPPRFRNDSTSRDADPGV
jgi:hypothetical protein